MSAVTSANEQATEKYIFSDLTIEYTLVEEKAPSKVWVFFNTCIRENIGILQCFGQFFHIPYMLIFGVTRITVAPDTRLDRVQDSVFKTSYPELWALGVISIILIIPAELIFVILKLVSYAFKDVRNIYGRVQGCLTPIRATIVGSESSKLTSWKGVRAGLVCLIQNSSARPIDVLNLVFKQGTSLEADLTQWAYDQMIHPTSGLTRARVIVLTNAHFAPSGGSAAHQSLREAIYRDRDVFSPWQLSSEQLPGYIANLSPDRKCIIYTQDDAAIIQ